MSKKNSKFKVIVHPLFLLLIGTAVGLFPAWNDGGFASYYQTFQRTDQVLLVYIIGIIAFGMGYLLMHLYINPKRVDYDLPEPRMSILAVLLIGLAGLLLVNTESYGGIPLFMILKGANISHVNFVQRQTASGLYGLQFLATYALIILLPTFTLYLKGNKAKVSLRILYGLQLAIVLFATTYSGKRQFIFILFTNLAAHLWIHAVLNEDRKSVNRLKKTVIGLFILAFAFFSSMGFIRAGYNVSVQNVLAPVIHYASLPYFNLNNIIVSGERNQYRFTSQSLIDTLTSGVPSMFRGDLKSITNIPKLERTSPNTVYGEIFWNFGYVGVIIFMYLVGLGVGYIYRQAMANKRIYISIYSLTVWPLLSIHTYNHFLNLTYLAIPTAVVILLEGARVIIPTFKSSRPLKKLE